jgi:hypothetical protein
MEQFLGITTTLQADKAVGHGHNAEFQVRKPFPMEFRDK